MRLGDTSSPSPYFDRNGSIGEISAAICRDLKMYWLRIVSQKFKMFAGNMPPGSLVNWHNCRQFKVLINNISTPNHP